MPTLEQICQLNEMQLYYFLKKFLRKHYKKIKVQPEYILAEGTIPIILVAHLDTIFTGPPNKIFYDPKEKVKWGLGGAGFDDRAGVWAIIRLVKEGYRPHIIFTLGEESGGVGASAVAAKPMPFAEAHFLVELDRQGHNDCVFYGCGNKDFQTFIESFGFKTAIGSFSDISLIAPSWDLAAVNLSIGYLYEHTASELFYEDWFEETLSKVKQILKTNTKYYDFQALDNKKGLVQCPCCNHFYPEEMIVKVQYSADGYLPICDNCFVDIEATLDWCKECGEPYYTTEEQDKCYHCKEEGIII